MKTFNKIGLYLILALWASQTALAEPSGPGNIDGEGVNQTTDPTSTTTTDVNSISIPNPLKVDSVQDLIAAIGNWLIGISAAVLVVMILWGAFQLMTSGGSEDRVSKGKKTIYWSILGFVVLLIAGGLASLIAEILGGANVNTNTGIDGGVSISGFGGVNGIIMRLARWMFGILMGLGIIMVLYSAFLYMFSGGSKDKTDAARKTLTYAIVAMAVAVVSGGVSVLIQNFLINTPSI